MTISNLKAFALAIVAGATLGLGSAAHAEEGSGTSAGGIDQQQIQAFAVARADVLDVQEEYSSRLQAAEGEQEAAEIRSEAQEEMKTAIQDAGLSIAEFNQIAQAAQSDEEIRKQVEQSSQ